MLAGNVQEARQPGAGSDEHGVEAFVLHQFVDGDRLAHHNVGFEDDPAAAQHFDFVPNNFLGQPEFRNAIHQNAAQFMQSFEHVHLVAHLDKVAGASQTRGAAADQANLLPGSWCGYWAIRIVRSRAPSRPQSAPGRRCQPARPSCPARSPTRTGHRPDRRGR